MADLRVFDSIEDFRRAARESGEPLADAKVRASVSASVTKRPEGEGRTIQFTISTGDVDRMGDTIAVGGWQLEEYRKNPIVLWAHDSFGLPIGRASKIWIENDMLKAEAEFTPPGVNTFADTVFEMLRQGFLNATSVGFRPLKYAFVDDPERRFGIDFLEQELLEFSVVPVPANAHALVDSKGFEGDLAPMREWAAKFMAIQGYTFIKRSAYDALASVPTVFRDWAEAVPSQEKGTRRNYRRCANFVERELKNGEAVEVEIEETEGTDAPPPAPPSPSAAKPKLEMAERRIKIIRERNKD